MFGKGKKGKKGALAAPKPSSWAIQGGAAEKIIVAEPSAKRRKGDGSKDGKNGKNGDGKDGKDGKGGQNGSKVDNELQKNQATDAQIEAICELLRSNKVDQALQHLQKDGVKKTKSTNIFMNRNQLFFFLPILGSCQ